MTQRIEIHPDNPQPRAIKQVAAMLETGGLALCPTDAGYGLVWNLNATDAEERVRRLRQLDNRHPFTLLCSTLSQAASLARLDDPAFRALRSLTPGPITFILPASNRLPNRLKTSGRSKRRDIGIRIPDYPVAQALILAVGEPLLSATLILPNDDDALDSFDADTVAERCLSWVDAMLDAGNCMPGPTSIVDCTQAEPSIVRQGFRQLEL